MTDLDELSLRLSLARGIDEVMAIVRSGVRPIVGADGITFVLRDGDKCFYADEDAISPLWKGQRFPLEACISGWAMLHREVVVIEDIYADSRIPHAAYRPTFVRSLVMVPVRDDDPVGAIGAYWSETRLPSAEDVRVLHRIANSAAVAMTNLALTSALRDARDEAVRAKDAIVFAMADLAETRDNDTGNHIRRTQHYVRALAEGCVEHGLYADQLDAETVALLFKSAPLHDIGKIGVPEHLLNKAGFLTAAELARIQEHAAIGAELLGGVDFPGPVADIVAQHHERLDGSGYPRGLTGDQMLFEARILAVADIFEAMSSARPYRNAQGTAVALAELRRHAGVKYDARVVAECEAWSRARSENPPLYSAAGKEKLSATHSAP